MIVNDDEGGTNRLQMAIELFDEICNSRYIQSPVILLLNKRDLFDEKIKKVPLNLYFPDYADSSTYQEACDYIQKKFVARNKSPNSIKTHFTCALDHRNMSFIFQMIHDLVIRHAFESNLRIKGNT